MAQTGSLALLLFVLIATAHLLGHLFTRLRQPRVVGEILAGVLLGPTLLGRLAPHPAHAIFGGTGSSFGSHDSVVEFLYWLGLLLLMFASGAETRHLFGRGERREIGWIAAVGTRLPFLGALVVGHWMGFSALMGRAGQRTPLLLVVAIAVAVTSIPVISRIFYDLKVLHTRFAGLVLGVAVIEDIALWAVLAVATALATSGSLPPAAILRDVVAAAGFFAFGLTLAPRLLRRLENARWNWLAAASPAGYVIVVLFAYVAIAGALNVNLVFAAFLAGYGVVGSGRFGEALDSIQKFSFALFVPVYFALVGYKLDLAKTFSLGMLVAFLLAACAVKVAAVGLGARLAGFRVRDMANLAIATNARGGPGIVLASVAFDAGIISAAFYTTLVLTAVLTSQLAGAWLEFVLKKGWPLLAPQADTTTTAQSGAELAA